jgi:hypothetical protein
MAFKSAEQERQLLRARSMVRRFPVVTRSPNRPGMEASKQTSREPSPLLTKESDAVAGRVCGDDEVVH